MQKLPKLQKGDRVAVVSPSFGAPAQWPHIYEFGLKRLREVFKLEPVEFPATKKANASGEERAQDLIAAFADPSIKAVIATLGGDDQVTYIKNLPKEPFASNPKPFFGYSDNTHFANFLWLNGIPSYYGGSLFVQIAENGRMNDFTRKYLNHAFFDDGEFELKSSEKYNDVGLNWDDPTTLTQMRVYEANQGWFWDNSTDAEGITWGGCIESVDEILRHGGTIPSLELLDNVVLILETSEELPPADYVWRVLRAFGERGILERVQGILVGRPKAWHFNRLNSAEQKESYRIEQRATIIDIVRKYNTKIPIVQNLDFGHTDPQIPMPYGSKVRIDGTAKKIFATF